jgi:hypothetical protein
MLRTARVPAPTAIELVLQSFLDSVFAVWSHPGDDRCNKRDDPHGGRDSSRSWKAWRLRTSQIGSTNPVKARGRV